MFCIDINKNYQVYFLAYIKALGLKDGDEVRGYEYMNWITQKHEEFRASIGVNRHVPYSEIQKKEFIEFISMWVKYEQTTKGFA